MHIDFVLLFHIVMTCSILYFFVVSFSLESFLKLEVFVLEFHVNVFALEKEVGFIE